MGTDTEYEYNVDHYVWESGQPFFIEYSWYISSRKRMVVFLEDKRGWTWRFEYLEDGVKKNFYKDGDVWYSTFREAMKSSVEWWKHGRCDESGLDRGAAL